MGKDGEGRGRTREGRGRTREGRGRTREGRGRTRKDMGRTREGHGRTREGHWNAEERQGQAEPGPTSLAPPSARTPIPQHENANPNLAARLYIKVDHSRVVSPTNHLPKSPLSVCFPLPLSLSHSHSLSPPTTPFHRALPRHNSFFPPKQATILCLSLSLIVSSLAPSRSHTLLSSALSLSLPSSPCCAYRRAEWRRGSRRRTGAQSAACSAPPRSSTGTTPFVPKSEVFFPAKTCFASPFAAPFASPRCLAFPLRFPLPFPLPFSARVVP